MGVTAGWVPELHERRCDDCMPSVLIHWGWHLRNARGTLESNQVKEATTAKDMSLDDLCQLLKGNA